MTSTYKDVDDIGDYVNDYIWKHFHKGSVPSFFKFVHSVREYYPRWIGIPQLSCDADKTALYITLYDGIKPVFITLVNGFDYNIIKCQKACIVTTDDSPLAIGWEKSKFLAKSESDYNKFWLYLNQHFKNAKYRGYYNNVFTTT